jgi:1-acyl-sn-glycerol-3-phosphate acyltransferase
VNGSVRASVRAVTTEWHERGTPYEVSRLITVPVRHGLVRTNVEHAERLPVEGPAIVVANHVSFFDSVLLMFGLPRPVALLGKAEYTERFVTRWLFCGAGMIPVHREDPADGARAVEELQRVLGDGGVVGIYPEGTRSRDGCLHRGHTGAAHLSLLTGAPIVPVGIVGTDQILPTGARVVRPFRRAVLSIGEPIRPTHFGADASTNRRRRQITNEMMAAVRQLSGQTYTDEFAPISSLPALAAHPART